jgi:hypothetical protein
LGIDRNPLKQIELVHSTDYSARFSVRQAKSRGVARKVARNVKCVAAHLLRIGPVRRGLNRQIGKRLGGWRKMEDLVAGDWLLVAGNWWLVSGILGFLGVVCGSG